MADLASQVCGPSHKAGGPYEKDEAQGGGTLAGGFGLSLKEENRPRGSARKGERQERGQGRLLVALQERVRHVGNGLHDLLRLPSGEEGEEGGWRQERTAEKRRPPQFGAPPDEGPRPQGQNEKSAHDGRVIHNQVHMGPVHHQAP